MPVGEPVRGSTGGTPGYGTDGGYSRSKSSDEAGIFESCNGGLAEGLITVFTYILDRRAARKAQATP